MSTSVERPPEEEFSTQTDGGLASSETETVLTLGALPLGARLILRCKKDWRGATIVATSGERVRLSVLAPSGRTYRITRPPDIELTFDGSIPILGEGQWRATFARYDLRW